MKQITSILVGAVLFFLNKCKGTVYCMVFSSWTVFLTSKTSGRNYASICCTELKINSSLETYTSLRSYNTFNATATNISGLYRTIKASHSKGKIKYNSKHSFLVHIFLQ